MPRHPHRALVVHLGLLLLTTGIWLSPTSVWAQADGSTSVGASLTGPAAPQLRPWQALLADHRVAGVVDVSIDGVTALHHGLGTDVSESDVDQHSVFWIGSISKQFVAAAVLRLVDAGKIALHGPVSDYLPLAADALQLQGVRCTVAQLLDHTCGLPAGSGRCPTLHLKRSKNRDRFLACVGGTTLSFQPGTKHQYANLGMDLAGVLVATVSGQSYGDFLREAFFKPLQMHSTGSDDLSERATVRTRLVQGKLSVFSARISTEMWLWLDPFGPGYRGASGNLYSTAHDLHIWNRALHRGGLLSKASHTAMTSYGHASYGLGIAIKTAPDGQTSYWHNGALAPMNWSAHLGYVTRLANVNGLDASVVVLTARSMKLSFMDDIGFGIVASLQNETPAKLPTLSTFAAMTDLIFYGLPLLILSCLLFVFLRLMRGPKNQFIPWFSGVLAACGVVIVVVNALDFFQQHVIILSLISLIPTVALVGYRHQVAAVRQALAAGTESRRALYLLLAVAALLVATSKGMGRVSLLSMLALATATATAISAHGAMGSARE